MSAKKLFLLNWKKFGLVLLAWIVSVVLHNLLSALLGVEEAVFFILAVIVLPVYLIIAIIYSLIHKMRNKQTPDQQ